MELPGPYFPLNADRKEIRVFDVARGGPDEPVRGSLRVVSLQDGLKPFYETISYVWGDARNRGTVYADGKAIDVAASTERVLRRMRFEYAVRALWIDGVCINQADKSDRSSQVQLMGEVYEGTFQNLVWLGDSDETTARAFWTARCLADEMVRRFGHLGDLSDLMTNEDGFWADDDVDFGPDLYPGDLARVFEKTYFQRLWIQQEIYLASSSLCVCGAHIISLRDLLRAGMSLVFRGNRWFDQEMVPQWHSQVELQYSLMTSKEGVLSEPLDLSDMLSVSFELEATEPRDKVFGILGILRVLGLINPQTASLLIVDYSKSVADVYRDATRASFQPDESSSGNLDLLSYVNPNGIYQKSHPGLPSWVPCYGGRLDKYRSGRWEEDTGFGADDWLNAQIEEHSDGSLLPVTGFHFSTLVETSQMWKTKPVGTSTRGNLLALVDAAERLSGGFNTEACAEVRDYVIAFTLGLSRRSQQESWYRAVYLEWKRFQLDGARSEVVDLSGPLPDNILGFHRWVIDVCHNRRLFSTENSLFGIGPGDAQVGDVLAILYGSRSPVILRPQGARYRFIGICYVHTIMYGEAVKMHRAEGKPDEVFCLE